MLPEERERGERIQVSFENKTLIKVIEHPELCRNYNSNYLLTTGKTHKRADVIETVFSPARCYNSSNVVYLKYVDRQEYEPKVQDRLDQRTKKNCHDVH